MEKAIRLCEMVIQGYKKGACEVKMKNSLNEVACKATLKYEGRQYHRVISAMHLSRPEDYFSIYQSGCNHNCLKCHSWEFSKHFNGNWYSTDEIAEECKQYEQYVTILEPRERALMYYANDLCKHCGSCILFNKRSPMCPNKVSKENIVLGPQGFGPARNIVAFTGGDIACQANFYVEVTKKIKQKCDDIWVLLESNGYGLTPKNLDLFQKAGLDSFWLDIKAYDEEIYKRLCGTSNKTVLDSPKEIIKRNFVLEILTVYIPNLIEVDQFEKIAQLIFEIDENIPFHILAFFPKYKLESYRSPTLDEILETYKVIKRVGLKKIQIGNIGVFARTDEEMKRLINTVGIKAI
ncbi:MAG: radical SAM protein [Candidatus Lokiarchaeota archaeon]|nr:radical SAM protein [Candidatus Lokiarchaeota archaeon]